MPTPDSNSRTITTGRQTLAQLVAPESQDYMNRAVTDVFDWTAILQRAARVAQPESGKYYLVVFRSTLKPGTDTVLVATLDEAAHTEAKASDALLYYFAGSPRGLSAMSWCLWTDMNEARKALAGTAHRTAASRAGDLYASFKIELYDVYLDGQRPIFEPVSKVRA